MTLIVDGLRERPKKVHYLYSQCHTIRSLKKLSGTIAHSHEGGGAISIHFHLTPYPPLAE